MSAPILVLGSGFVGEWAARGLREQGPHQPLWVADRDGRAAQRLAQAVGASAHTVDVTDRAALKALLRQVGLVLNTVGPYFRFGAPTLASAIDAGCDYLDVCDDPTPTERMLAQSARAASRGVTAVIGLGISPGVSNLLAARAVAELPGAHTVITGWDAAHARPAQLGRRPSAAMIHGVEQLSGRIPIRRGGAQVAARPLQRVWLDYPGLGRRWGATIGHPEPVTLPRVFPHIRESVNLMSLDRRSLWAARGLARLVDAGVMTRERAAWAVERAEGPAPGDLDPQRLIADVAAGRTQLPAVFAWAEGVRDGRPAQVGVTLTAAPRGGMGGATGLPLAVGAALWRSGQLRRPGVHPPEAVVPLDAFFDRLGPLCTPPGDGQALVAVQRSWQPAPFARSAARP